MNLHDVLFDYFTHNNNEAERFMHGHASRCIEDLILSIDASYSEVDSYGGEDCGSTYYRVYCFQSKDEKVYIKFNGWYASHYGSEYEDYFFVKPKQVTVTQFENE